MKVSASIEFVCQLGRQEAIATDFDEITPNHFFAALLKFAELPTEEIEHIVQGQNVARDVTIDINAVRDSLIVHSINSNETHNKILSGIGKGNSKFDGQIMHRSQAAKALFDFAFQLADEARCETLTPVHLLEAMLASPTEVMAQVLSKPTAQLQILSIKTPILDKYSRDLTYMAAEGKLEVTTEHTVETKACLQALSQAQANRKSVLMITNDELAVKQIVCKIAQVIAAKNCPGVLMSKRIMDITSFELLNQQDIESNIQLNSLFAEAAKSQDIILFVPPIITFSQGNEWISYFKTILTKHSIQYICQVTPEIYTKYIKRDGIWKRLVHTILVQLKSQEDIPSEL
jgi:ATP-dependent Clp protease ATP-binding subunit ClpA